MTTSHTAGPWHRNIPPASHYCTIFSGRNKHVAMVCTKGLTETEIEANCNLIAAAPEILSLLEESLVFIPDTHLLDRARKAISKASGQK